MNAGEADFCHVADGDCRAPAGYRSGSGIADGDRKTRAVCVPCGRHVCVSCSRIRVLRRRRQRVCNDCAEEMARDAVRKALRTFAVEAI